jgi:hypothetical protein
MFFQSTMTRARESKTLILPPAIGHCHLLLQLSLPKFCACFLSLEIKRLCYCRYSFQTELFKAQVFQACSLLAIAISDFALGGHHLASFLLVANRAFLLVVLMLIVSFIFLLLGCSC